jgi:hypothetical protein
MTNSYIDRNGQAMGFENGSPVPITEAITEPSRAEQVLDHLREIGLEHPEAAQAIEACIDAEIGTRIEERVDQRAADLLAQVVHRLGIKSPEGIALRIAICGMDRSYESYRDAAKGAGISYVGLWKKVRRILKTLSGS